MGINIDRFQKLQESITRDNAHYNLSYLWDRGESQSRICTRLVSQRLWDSPTNLLQRDMPRLPHHLPPTQWQPEFDHSSTEKIIDGYAKIHAYYWNNEERWNELTDAIDGQFYVSEAYPHLLQHVRRGTRRANKSP